MGKIVRNMMRAVLLSVVFGTMWTADASAAAQGYCYTIADSGAALYRDKGLTEQTGTVRGTDELRLEAVRTDSVKVSYLLGGEETWGYIAKDAVLTGQSKKIYTSKAKIKVRRRPGGGLYGTLSVGTPVKVLGTWQGHTQVYYLSDNGYRYGFITKAEADRYILLKKAPKTYYVKKKTGLPLRVSPAGKAYQISNLFYRSSVRVYFIKDKWAYVRAGGQEGFCPAAQLSRKRPAMTTAVSYAPYRGVDYKKQRLSAARIAALDKAKKMTTIQWTAPCTFPTWASANGSITQAAATDGSSSGKFVKGKVYTGVPYSMIDNNIDDRTWKELLQQKITKASMTGRFGSYPVSGTAKGIDCSHFVYQAIGSAVGFDKISYQPTGMMAGGLYYKKISLGKMKPGDIFLSSGHAMMYVGKTGGQYAVFEASSVESKCAYHVYGIDYIRTYGCYRYKGFRD